MGAVCVYTHGNGMAHCAIIDVGKGHQSATVSRLTLTQHDGPEEVCIYIVLPDGPEEVQTLHYSHTTRTHNKLLWTLQISNKVMNVNQVRSRQTSDSAVLSYQRWIIISDRK